MIKDLIVIMRAVAIVVLSVVGLFGLFGILVGRVDWFLLGLGCLILGLHLMELDRGEM